MSNYMHAHFVVLPGDPIKAENAGCGVRIGASLKGETPFVSELFSLHIIGATPEEIDAIAAAINAPIERVKRESVGVTAEKAA